MQVLSKMLNLNDILCSSWEKYYKELPDLMKYKQKDLKYICKKNILHVTGKKSILVERIKNKYERDYNAHIIQKYVRRKIAINYIYFKGPAVKTRQCTNDTDFLTLESFDKLHIKDFFSYTDVDGFTFGFDFTSIYGLIKRSKTPNNPYNRKEIPKKIIYILRRLRKMNRIYYPKENKIENKLMRNTNEFLIQDSNQMLVQLERLRTNKTFNDRVSNLFYDIDQLGNYTVPDWLIELSRDNFLKFIKFLYEIWNYRAGISPETKINICPYYNPFNYKGICRDFSINASIITLKNMAIGICENLFYTARNDEYKKLSAIYILMALTTVSNSARNSIPWLYESTI
jgi:hypothetical protein